MVRNVLDFENRMFENASFFENAIVTFKQIFDIPLLNNLFNSSKEHPLNISIERAQA